MLSICPHFHETRCARHYYVKFRRGRDQLSFKMKFIYIPWIDADPRVTMTEVVQYWQCSELRVAASAVQ